MRAWQLLKKKKSKSPKKLNHKADLITLRSTGFEFKVYKNKAYFANFAKYK